MDVSLGERELDVLSALWRHGAGTVADVRKQLPAELAYNTVLTILRNLEAKELVGHTEEGRLHRYHALVAQDAVRGNQVTRLVDKLFRGSPLDLLAHLVSNERMSSDEMRSLQQLLDARLDAVARADDHAGRVAKSTSRAKSDATLKESARPKRRGRA